MLFINVSAKVQIFRQYTLNSVKICNFAFDLHVIIRILYE